MAKASAIVVSVTRTADQNWPVRTSAKKASPTLDGVGRNSLLTLPDAVNPYHATAAIARNAAWIERVAKLGRSIASGLFLCGHCLPDLVAQHRVKLVAQS